MPNEKKIQAVVLDIGEVLIKLNFERLFTTFGLGNPKNKMASLDQMARWQMYDRFERGHVTEDEFQKALEESIQRPLKKPEFLAAWNSALVGTVDGIPDLLKNLRSKVGLFALTNSNETHMRAVMKDYPWMDQFHEVFTSFELKARKPEKEIFERMVKKIGIPAENMLFIDDRMENVLGARASGLAAEVSVESPNDLKAALRRYGLM